MFYRDVQSNRVFFIETSLIRAWEWELLAILVWSRVAKRIFFTAAASFSALTSTRFSETHRVGIALPNLTSEVARQGRTNMPRQQETRHLLSQLHCPLPAVIASIPHPLWFRVWLYLHIFVSLRLSFVLCFPYAAVSMSYAGKVVPNAAEETPHSIQLMASDIFKQRVDASELMRLT